MTTAVRDAKRGVTEEVKAVHVRTAADKCLDTRRLVAFGGEVKRRVTFSLSEGALSGG